MTIFKAGQKVPLKLVPKRCRSICSGQECRTESLVHSTVVRAVRVRQWLLKWVQSGSDSRSTAQLCARAVDRDYLLEPSHSQVLVSRHLDKLVGGFRSIFPVEIICTQDSLDVGVQRSIAFVEDSCLLKLKPPI